MFIIPAIDLRDGRCVRLMQGRKDNATVYDGDPIEIALSYEASGAQLIHMVDLDGAFSDPNSRNRQVLRKIISRITIPLQFGGGLRSLEDVAQVIELGVSRVVVGTLAVESPDVLARLVDMFGSRVCVGIDARDNQVMTRGWEKREIITAVELAQRVAAFGVERIVYTDVARDGMLAGVNLEQTCTISRESGLRVTASGGVSSLADISRLRGVSESGVDSVIVGKALYEGRFTLKEAINEGSVPK
ncbi:MAG TPA: 1-(5-phosphoribosyl)-5-[(5-phosphoribosylamino)methylideneamino]imidazole-4-carboxamide isomerase [Blastocatellia bacterium]|nr:1-(5-phosphoribosyl)-5-[(5-phosphoribosylamino)methylideneamino]imidazole-4-carboxamide isomerase [Blastocatellia bacterium]HAF22722.1 1-(5-phosphoribosyl)-5-[(5-phosphoribosylamino)methylideneamino]imidazole-4-carboxamide isomerase [Blastocatellia bacterium]